MPMVAELKEIDGAMWARLEMGLGSPIQLLSPEEIQANSDREHRYLAEIERLRDAMERAIVNLDDNHARRVLGRALSRRREPSTK